MLKFQEVRNLVRLCTSISSLSEKISSRIHCKFDIKATFPAMIGDFYHNSHCFSYQLSDVVKLLKVEGQVVKWGQPYFHP